MKERLGALFSLCRLIKSFLLQEISLLFLDLLAVKTTTNHHLFFFQYGPVSLGCTSHGILHTLVTFASDFVCEPLPRIVTKTPNVFSHIPAASLSLSRLLIQCLSFHCHQKVASRTFFKNVKENSEDFQLIRIAGCFSQ